MKKKNNKKGYSLNEIQYQLALNKARIAIEQCKLETNVALLRNSTHIDSLLTGVSIVPKVLSILSKSISLIPKVINFVRRHFSHS
jgi:hypothetical protein